MRTWLLGVLRWLETRLAPQPPELGFLGGDADIATSNPYRTAPPQVDPSASELDRLMILCGACDRAVGWLDVPVAAFEPGRGWIAKLMFRCSSCCQENATRPSRPRPSDGTVGLG